MSFQKINENVDLFHGMKGPGDPLSLLPPISTSPQNWEQAVCLKHEGQNMKCLGYHMESRLYSKCSRKSLKSLFISCLLE